MIIGSNMLIKSVVLASQLRLFNASFCMKKICIKAKISQNVQTLAK